MKSPAFQTYASDFYMDTNSWTIDEMGIYQRLLLTEWINGGLPNDEKRLSRIAGCSTKKFQKGWTTIKVKFTQNGSGLLINKKMEEVRQDQLKYSESRRKNVSIRYKDKSTYEPTYEEDMKPVCNLSSSSSSLINNNKEISTFCGKPKPKYYKNERGNYICSQCQKSFMEYNNLQEHFKEHSKDQAKLIGV